MPESFQTRAATLEDLPEVLALYKHLIVDETPLPEDAAAAIFERLNKIDGSAILISRLGNTIVSSCTLVIIPNLTRSGAPYALIENVVTHTAYRKQGFGKAILEAAIDRAWKRGCYKTMLLAGSKTPAILHFYKSAGFSQSKTGFQIRRIGVRAG
ncbi:MAG TPA: GNAT family N-acetyltransferase [Rhodobacteraceae bacterium]|nr:GNAT family N-acetyltransferase [Paracoccaceae bacterium]